MTWPGTSKAAPLLPVLLVAVLKVVNNATSELSVVTQVLARAIAKVTYSVAVSKLMDVFTAWLKQYRVETGLTHLSLLNPYPPPTAWSMILCSSGVICILGADGFMAPVGFLRLNLA